MSRWEVLDMILRCNLLPLKGVIADARETGVLTVDDHRALDRVIAAIVEFNAHVRRTSE